MFFFCSGRCGDNKLKKQRLSYIKQLFFLVLNKHINVHFKQFADKSNSRPANLRSICVAGVYRKQNLNVYRNIETVYKTEAPAFFDAIKNEF